MPPSNPPPQPQAISGKIPAELAALIILLIGVLFTIAAPPAQIIGRCAALGFSLILGVVLAIWAEIPRFRVPPIARYVTAVIWAILCAAELFSIVRASAPATGPMEVLRDGVRLLGPDNPVARGRLVIVLPIKNNTNKRTPVYIHAGLRVSQYDQSNYQHILNETNAAKSDANKDVVAYPTEPPIPMGPQSGPEDMQADYMIGPAVNDRDWKAIERGDKSVYIYAIVLIDNDASESPHYCGISLGTYGPPMGCPYGLESR